MIPTITNSCVLLRPYPVAAAEGGAEGGERGERRRERREKKREEEFMKRLQDQMVN
jgi:hypothetical protein